MAVTKFVILDNLGCGYTFSNLDEEEYRNVALLMECTKWNNKKLEMDRNHADFYSVENMRR